MKRNVIILLVLFFFPGLVFAQLTASVESMNIVLDLSTTTASTETMTITAINNYDEPTDTIYVLFNNAPYNLDVTNENGFMMNYSVLLTNGVYSVKINEVIAPNSSEIFILSFSNNAVESIEEYFLMSYSFTSYYSLDDFYLRILLPSGYGITQKEGSSISPQPSRLYSDGQQIIVEWIEPINYLESNAYFLFFEELSTSTTSIGSFILFVLIGFILGFAVSYVWLKRKSKEIITMALTPDEKNIIDLLMRTKKDIFQNDIGKKLDFSKPKLSKIIHVLENKKILIVIPAGRRNKIELNKEIL